MNDSDMATQRMMEAQREAEARATAADALAS